MREEHGIRGGLTNYGDKDFAEYLRSSFARVHGPVKGNAAQADRRHRRNGVRFQQLPPHDARTGRGCVARGVLAAGGLPTTLSLRPLLERYFLNPTSMVYRNLMSMDTEEMVRAQPMDAVVLIGGCDKTVPRAIDGCRIGKHPGGATGDRADDDGAPQGRAAGGLHRLPPVLGQIPRGRGRA